MRTIGLIHCGVGGCRQSGTDLQQHQSQAKQLCRKLNAQSPERCTLEAGDMNFQLVTLSSDDRWCSVLTGAGSQRLHRLLLSFLVI